tara:strand:- start:34 stop:843 length:810 start_codon:yes stop_codon:yes gene_type:complete
MFVDLYGDGIGKVEYVEHMGTDLTVVNSARVSFGREKSGLDERDKKLIRYLASHKHTSTFEHNVVTFKFTVPLYIRSQHHRHRTWSYNEISRRYTDINIRFYEPDSFRTQSKSNRQASNKEEKIDPVIVIGKEEVVESAEIKSSASLVGSASKILSFHHNNCINIYNSLIESGICREQARGVLPQGMYTEYYGTVNLNNLIKFIDLRIHEGAQFEIQQVAKACLSIAKTLWPYSVSFYMDSNNILEEALLPVDGQAADLVGQKVDNSPV